MNMAVLPFLKVATRDIQVGAVMPSSSYAVRRILSRLPDTIGSVLEYGPGDGVITTRLLERLRPDGRMLAIEANQEFARKTKGLNDPRLEVVHGDATAAQGIARQKGFGEFDLVISGIPFGMLSRTKRHAVVEMTHAMVRPGGIFLVYQTSPLMRRYLQQHFSVTTVIEPRNVPPYFIMRAEKR